MSEELKPCEICGGSTVEIEPAGMIWKGTGGYSDPQYWRLLHWGQLETGEDADPFPTCKVEMRHRTEAQLVAAWNQRAKPVVKALEWGHAAFYIDGSFGRALVVRQSVTALGRYEIAKNDDGTFSCHFNGRASALYGCEDEAKAAAQADFTRRVHACLEGYDD